MTGSCYSFFIVAHIVSNFILLFPKTQFPRQSNPKALCSVFEGYWGFLKPGVPDPGFPFSVELPTDFCVLDKARPLSVICNPFWLLRLTVSDKLPCVYEHHQTDAWAMISKSKFLLCNGLGSLWTVLIMGDRGKHTTPEAMWPNRVASICDHTGDHSGHNRGLPCVLLEVVPVVNTVGTFPIPAH